MKIIQDGDINKAQAYMKFTCYDCGCVFEAKRGEYHTEYEKKSNGHNHYYDTVCPCCERTVLKMETFRYERNKGEKSRPAVDTVPVEPAQWLKWPNHWAWLVCSKCNEKMMVKKSNHGYIQEFPHNYCPNCGTKMSEEDTK